MNANTRIYVSSDTRNLTVSHGIIMVSYVQCYYITCTTLQHPLDLRVSLGWVHKMTNKKKRSETLAAQTVENLIIPRDPLPSARNQLQLTVKLMKEVFLLIFRSYLT